MRPCPDPLHTMPEPAAIHQRLGEVIREEQLLRRLLRLSMAAQELIRRPTAASALPAQEDRHGD